MRRNKEEFNAEISEKEKQSLQECCMCGDYGLTFELFRCKVCKNKSQHRYCSIEYPKADSYEICNWCLSQRNVPVDGQMEDGKIEINRRGGGGGDQRQISPKGEKNKGSVIMKLKVINNNKPVKKPKSPPPRGQGSPLRPPAARKRTTVVGSGDDEKLRRTRSEQALQRSNSTIIKKHVFKNKVKRYKLLNEVSC